MNGDGFNLQPAFDPSVHEYLCDTRSEGSPYEIYARAAITLNRDPDSGTLWGYIDPNLSESDFCVADITGYDEGFSKNLKEMMENGQEDSGSEHQFFVNFRGDLADVPRFVIDIYVHNNSEYSKYTVTLLRDV